MLRASSPSTDEKYGFHYFDKSSGGRDEKEEEDAGELGEFGVNSCSPDCCDRDCECDDCLRCSESAFADEESLIFQGAAG